MTLYRVPTKSNTAMASTTAVCFLHFAQRNQQFVVLEMDCSLVNISTNIFRVGWDWSVFCLFFVWFVSPLFVDCQVVSIRAWRLGLIRAIGALCVWDGCLLLWAILGGDGGVALCALFVPCWTIGGLVTRRSAFVSVHGKVPLLR